MDEVHAVSIDWAHDRLLLSNGDLVAIYTWLDDEMEEADPDHADTVVYLDGVGNLRAAVLDDLDLLTVH